MNNCLVITTNTIGALAPHMCSSRSGVKTKQENVKPGSCYHRQSNARTNKESKQIIVDRSSCDCGSPASSAGCTTAPTLTSAGLGLSQCVLGEGTGKSLLAGNFLAADEALNCNADGTVNVGRRNIVSQTHTAESLADANDGLQMTDLKSCVSKVVRDEANSGLSQ